MTDFDTVIREVTAIGEALPGLRADPAMREDIPGKPGTVRADLLTHTRLIDLFTRLDPETPVLSEEDVISGRLATHAASRPPRYWIIDPIDGTASWKGGFTGYVTQVALVEGEHAVFGLIHAPAMGDLFVARAGRGATCNGIRLAPQAAGPGLTLIDNYPAPRGFAAAIAPHLGMTRYVESGSIGLKLARLADGTADLFVKGPEITARDWDMAPALCLLGETGGVLDRLDGTPWRLSGDIEKTGGFAGLARASDRPRLAAALAALAAATS